MPYHYVFRGTIKAKANFNDDDTVEALEQAFKGRGCDKEQVVHMITHINNPQRQMLRTPYERKYGKDLIAVLKKELSGDLEGTIIGLMETPTKYDAIQMFNAVKGMGTQETTLIDILCSRTNEELKAIQREFHTEYNVTLEAKIKGDTGGDFLALLLALLRGERDDSYNVNVTKAREDAKRIFGNKVLKEKPDKEVLCRVMAYDNFRQIKRMFSEYTSMYGEAFQDGVKRIFSGDAEAAYLALVDFIENKEHYFAKQLLAAMEGMGTRDNDLIRIIISRSEIDLEDIRDEFNRLNKKPLNDWLKSECSGAYRDALISLVNGN